MEFRVIESKLSLKPYEIDLLNVPQFKDVINASYPCVIIRFTSSDIHVNGRQEDVEKVVQKIKTTLADVKRCSYTVSKSTLTVLQEDSVYAHMLSLFRKKSLNCTYDAHSVYYTILFVYGFDKQEIDVANEIITLEIKQCKIPMTKALRQLLKCGTILTTKLDTECAKGYLQYSIRENDIKLCGILKSLDYIKSVIDKLTSDSIALSTRAKQGAGLSEMQSEQLDGGKLSELVIDLKGYECVLLSNCDIVANLSNAFPDLHVRFTPSSIILHGELFSVQTAEIQIQELRRSVLKFYSSPLNQYAPLLDSDDIFQRIMDMLRKEDINGTYVVSGGVVVYLCAIDEMALGQLKHFMETTFQEKRCDFSASLSNCLLPNGCLYKELKKQKESNLIEFSIYHHGRFVRIYGIDTIVNELVNYVSKRSIETEHRPHKIAVCNHHSAALNSNDRGLECPTTTDNPSHDITFNTGSTGETDNCDSDAILKPNEPEIQPSKLDVFNKEIPILCQYSKMLLQHKLANLLEDMLDDIKVDVMDDHVHLAGSVESVETATHYVDEVIGSIQNCDVDIDSTLISRFENENLSKELHSCFRHLDIVATYKVTETSLEVYAIGSVALAKAVQCITEILPKTDRGGLFSGTDCVKLQPISTRSNDNDEFCRPESNLAADTFYKTDKTMMHRSEVLVPLDDSALSTVKRGNKPELSPSDMSPKISNASSETDNANNHQHSLQNKKGFIQGGEHATSPKRQSNVLNSQVSSLTSSLFSQSISPTSITTASSQTLPFKAYEKDDVASLLVNKDSRDSCAKDELDKIETKHRNLSSSSIQTNLTTASSRHQLIPSGSRHTIIRTLSTPSTSHVTEDSVSTSSTSRFIMDTPAPSTSTQASTSIYSRSLSSNYEPMDIDITSSYLYAPRREQKLTIIDSFRVAKTKVSLVAGCITLCQVDVIINETNPDLNLCQGAVSSAILEKEQGMQAECNAKSPQGIDTGEVCITQANSMKCQFVYHVTCCEEKDARKSSEKAIKDTVLCCLTAINDTNLSSVAISPLGTTRSRVPREKSAVVMLEEIVDFLTNHKDTTISHIDIVLHEMDTRSHPVFEDEFANVALKFDPERRKTRSRYSWMRNYDWQL